MDLNYLQRILTSRVYDVAMETPLDVAPGLSGRLGNDVRLKREDLQPIFSFKIRGAYNRMAALREEERSRGVIAASAGNHAQGVAFAARRLVCRALIVMPVTTPKIKISSVKAFGAEVELFGDSYHDAYLRARELQEQDDRIFIHPYDDPDVIAGQGTIGMEILRQSPHPPDAIFVPVGGGGLISGIASFFKNLSPTTRIIGVEPADADAMYRSLKAGRRVTLGQVGLFADGVAVAQVGENTFALCREYVDEIVRVHTDAICAAVKDVFEDTRSVLEPAGALSIAGLKSVAQERGMRDQLLVAVASGANVNFNRLRHISERAELGEETEAILAVTIPEKPGSMRAFCEQLGDRGVTEFNYRFAESGEAHVFVGLQVDGRDEVKRLIQSLTEAGIRTRDFTDNEIAKNHIKHMVGGRAFQIEHERLFRFEFPERPGALGQFLAAMQHDWNISLFHYRNYGAAYGRVLVGMQVPPSDFDEFAQFLNRVGYAYEEETGNPAYGLFLGPTG